MADQIECSCEDIVPDGKIPGDVMVSILMNLPVKSLLKFKAVSKPWCSLISSPRFFKIHLHRQSVVADNCLMLLKDDSVEQDLKFGLLNLTHNYNYNTPADDDVLMLEISPLLSPQQKQLGIIDSCNGLVCLGSFVIGSSDLILWNPATRRYRSLDLPKGDDDLTFRTLGLCYVDATNDFKVLVWNHSHPPSPVDTPYLYVYSLSSDSWDKLDYYAQKTDIHFEPPTFLGRCMHWLAHTCPNGFECTCSSASEIVAIDVTDGAMSCFHLPVNCGRHSLTLKQTLVISGCLSIMILRDAVGDDVEAMESGFEVWVMEEYGVEGSWVKRFFIQDFTQVRLPLISWNYGEIVFNSENDVSKVVIFYDPYSEKKNYVEFLSFHVLSLFNYVESLASVGTS